MADIDVDSEMEKDLQEFIATQPKPRPSKQEKRAERFDRAAVTPTPTIGGPGVSEPFSMVGPEELLVMRDRVNALWANFTTTQLGAALAAGGKRIKYQCQDPNCLEIVEALSSEERLVLPDSHPDKRVRCPNVGTNRHANGGLTVMNPIE